MRAFSMPRCASAAALAVCLATLVSGCSGGGEPTAEATFTGLPVYRDEARFRQDLADLAAQRGIENPPQVEIVRWVKPSESSKVLAECLTEAGFKASVVGDGWDMEVEYSVNQEDAYSLAAYICTARYPMEQAAQADPPEEYVRAVYDHFTGEAVACLEGFGAQVEDVPTWETFRDTFDDPDTQWSPFAHVRTQNGGGLTEEMLDECPALPPEATAP